MFVVVSFLPGSWNDARSLTSVNLLSSLTSDAAVVVKQPLTALSSIQETDENDSPELTLIQSNTLVGSAPPITVTTQVWELF
jgi:hypothetical protein